MKRAWITMFVVLIGGVGTAQDDPQPIAAKEERMKQAITGPTDIRQVQVNVIIGEFGEQGVREIGTNLNFTRFVGNVEQSGSIERVTTNVFDPRNDDFRVTLPVPDENPFPDNLRPDLEGNLSDGVQTQTGAGLTFGIVDNGRGTVDGVLRGVETKTDVDLNSKPEILVANQQQASIHAGSEIPFQDITFTGSGNTVPVLDVTWEKTGVNVDLTPTIRNDGLIEIFLQNLDVTELSRVENVRGLDLPVFTTRSQVGHVLVPDKKSVVIGGLSSRVVRKNERRVPVLGKIPLLGIAFRGRQNEADTNTLFIFLTPTIVDLRETEREAMDALDFWRNTEWRNRDRIEAEIEAMEQDL